MACVAMGWPHPNIEFQVRDANRGSYEKVPLGSTYHMTNSLYQLRGSGRGHHVAVLVVRRPPEQIDDDDFACRAYNDFQVDSVIVHTAVARPV